MRDREKNASEIKSHTDNRIILTLFELGLSQLEDRKRL